MLGGYQVLDLRKIDLSHGTSEASISDASVLSQLLNIRDHIQKTYDFSKPLQNQLKPLLIRYRDKKVGEKHEVALYGNIEVINVYYKFRIIANNEGEQLTINVEFEEKTDEYSNKYWDIKTAKILLTNNQTINGDLEVTGDIKGNMPYEVIANLSAEGSWLNGLKAENVYGKMIKENNVLYIVFSCRLVNETEQEISTEKNTGITGVNSVSTDISSKIFRKDGTNCSQAVVSGDNITGLHGFVSQATLGVQKDILCSCYSSAVNFIGIWVGNDDANKISVPAGGSMDFDVRLFIIL